MKKLISLVLVAVLALSLATAYAVPSKTTTDLAKVIDVETTGEKPADDFAIVIVEDSEAAKAIAALTGREDDFGVARLATMQDVLSVTQNEINEEQAAKELMEALNLAIDGMLAMRKREGENLVATILTKVQTLEGIREEVVTRSPEVVEAYRQKLAARINEILTSDQREFYDDNRLAAEVAIFADKCAIDEEMARLSSHFSQARKILAEDGSVGKKMDFLVQEINREVNTTGSKANDIEITSRVLSMKNLVEEIREQIQNLV